MTIHPDLERVLLTEAQLQEGIDALRERLAADYSGRNPLFVCILKGCVHFYSDLLKRMPFPCEYDFIVCSSYGESTESAGTLQITKDLSVDIAGRDVILVDDIIDSGLTLDLLTRILRKRGPASVKTCTLLDKPERRTSQISADYSCFTIPNAFVVGYGLDYSQHYRNLPYIGILKPEIYRG